ncbi:hypothetical protein GCM10011613_23310 [Cellvibrio zantedeschiae]|uniref:Uncharacterized protein n=1 Tax=Cellvibrio zantedeschiae TaxID=1237077 RepID=A0ABQ3B6Z4_9GAMM|nr:hypothetical protein GCM10011613_23310 [Cellvibrio zantedeschiae]
MRIQQGDEISSNLGFFNVLRLFEFLLQKKKSDFWSNKGRLKGAFRSSAFKASPLQPLPVFLLADDG